MRWSVEYNYHDPKKVHLFTVGTPDASRGAARILSLSKTGTPAQRKTADEIIWSDDDLIGFDEQFADMAEVYGRGTDIYAGLLVILALRVGTDTPPLKTDIVDAIRRDDDRSLAEDIAARMAANGWSEKDIAELRRAACAIWS